MATAWAMPAVLTSNRREASWMKRGETRSVVVAAMRTEDQAKRRDLVEREPKRME